MGGYFGVERDFLDSDFWLAEPFTKAQAWIDLFGIANHSDGFFFKRGMKITVLRGQIGRSELTLSARWGWSRNKVRRFLKWLEKEVMISLKQDNKTTIITICNYDIYQGKKHVNDTANDTANGTPERHQKDTKRNTNKNVNKEKKNKRNPLEEKAFFISGIPDSIYKTYPDFSKNEIESIVDNLVDYCLANGKTYKDYYAALRNFLKSERKNKNGSCSINEKKIDFDRYKKLFSHAKAKTKNGDKPKFKEDGLNQILLKYPHILEYEADSVSFEITYKEYLKL